jgi:hypothetical protein
MVAAEMETETAEAGRAVARPERLNPTLRECYEFYRALPKRQLGAVTQCPTSCLIAEVIWSQQPDIAQLGDIEVHPSAVDDNDHPPHIAFSFGREFSPDSDTAPLDPVLNRLALAFDQLGEGRRGEQADIVGEVEVSNGACARIIARFARAEGIDLGGE